MRPRQNAAEYDSRVVPGHAVQVRFNEAAAERRGIPEPAPQGVDAILRFNEAAAERRGIRSGDFALEALAHLASMRPRQNAAEYLDKPVAGLAAYASLQ